MLPDYGPSVWEGLPHVRGGWERSKVMMMMVIVAGMWEGDTRDSGAAMELCDGVHLACVHRSENLCLSSHHSTKCVQQKTEDTIIYSKSLI